MARSLAAFFGLLCSLSFSVPSSAYLSDAPYHLATEPAALALDSYSHWDSEAASDFITYLRPIEWDGYWWHSTRAFDLSMGSISSKQFLQHQRLKIFAPLNDKVEFRFQFLQERDFEQDRVAMPLELRFHVMDGYSFSVLGQPSLYKSEDDVGLAFTMAPEQGREVQFTALWGDFQRNERNLQSDRWAEAPTAYTLTSTNTAGGDGPADFARSVMHYEPRSRRVSATGVNLNTLSYKSWYISGLRTFGPGSTVAFRIMLDEAFHSDEAAGTVSSRFRSLNQLEYGYYHGAIKMRPGLNIFYRENHVNQAREYYREILPVWWVDLPERAKSWGHHAWSMGYDATVFNRDSSTRGEDREIEHRLNIKSTMKFSKAGELALLFTFDMDRFGGGETWEGGCGQFRLMF